jgi:hypothetical protein
MREGVPGNQRSTSPGPSPTASKICAPQYDCTVEIPIFERTFSSPFSTALMYFASAVASSIGGGSLPARTRPVSVSNAR